MKSYLRILSYFKKYWIYLVGVLFSTLFFTASNILLMPLVRNITSAIQGGATDNFHNWMIDGILLFFLQSFSKYGQAYLMAIVGYKTLRDIRIQIYRNLQMLSLDFYAKWRVGELISRTTNDTNLVQNTTIDLFSKLLPNLLTVVGVLVYLFRINFLFAASMITIIPLYTLFIGKVGIWLKFLTTKHREKLANMVVILQETLSNIRIVKSFTKERHEIKKYVEENNNNLRIEIQQVRIGELKEPIMSFLNALIVVFIFWIGGQQIIAGTLPPEKFAEFLTGIALLPGPILAISQVYINMQKSIVGADRFFELIDMKPSVKEKSNPIKLENVKGEIKFINVSFSYNKEDLILKDINLHVSPGEVIAIVGQSGAGKTTLINLIPRFYDTTSGHLLIDNTNIKDLSFSSLRNNIGIVPQETMLFNGSILENIMYGKNIATKKEEVITAAKAANAHSFISMFPDGYDTLVGDQGVRLSGGQKQRVAIARAILRNPKILILDEATSSLDTESERLVQEALERLMAQRTTFVIAHRLSTVIHATKIIVLKEGKIVEIGNHQELIKKDGIYKNLYNLQFKI